MASPDNFLINPCFHITAWSLVKFDDFLKILERPGGFEPIGSLEEFTEGFRVFDKDHTGLIAASELRYGKPIFFLIDQWEYSPILFKITEHSHFVVLTNLGEKLSTEEADELLKNVEVDKNGNVNYEGEILWCPFFVFVARIKNLYKSQCRICEATSTITPS